MTPSDELLAAFDNGARGVADVDMRGVLIDVINDVCSSYELAMQHAGINPDVIGSIQTTVGDYIANNYGDD